MGVFHSFSAHSRSGASRERSASRLRKERRVGRVRMRVCAKKTWGKRVLEHATGNRDGARKERRFLRTPRDERRDDLFARAFRRRARFRTCLVQIYSRREVRSPPREETPPEETEAQRLAARRKKVEEAGHRELVPRTRRRD